MTKEFLIDKVKTHSFEKFNEFHNNVPTTINEKSWSPYIWGHTNNGYYMYTHNRAVFMDRSNGLVHRIRHSSDTSSTEFEKHKLLYKLSTTRMDIPVHYEQLGIINDVDWVYTVVERPNKQLGSGHAVTINELRKDPYEFFTEFIFAHKNILETFPIIVNELGHGIPKYCELGKYLTDDMGLFVTDFKYWRTPLKGFIDFQLNRFSNRLDEWNSKFAFVQIDKSHLLDVAFNEWSSINGYN